MRRPSQVALALVVVASLAAGVAAHVAPSARENNRYVVLAPLGDRLRLVYVVYMGEEPGRHARARMDRDHDRRISDAEANAWAGELAADVAAGLALEVDGRSVAIRWAEVEVGLGDPDATAGSFAVDLVAWSCFDRPHEKLDHRVRFTDRFAMPDPGESELRVEESPGVSVARSALGAGAAASSPPRLDFKWVGGAGPAASGYELDFKVDPALAMFSPQPCPSGAAPPASPHLRPWLIAAAAATLLTIVALVVLRSRRRRV